MFENSELKYENLIDRYFIEYVDGSTFVLDIYWDKNTGDAEQKKMSLVLYYINVTELALNAMKNFVNDFNMYTSIEDQKTIRRIFSNNSDHASRKQFIKNLIEIKLGNHIIKNIKAVDELETGIGENELTRLSDYS